ncbi:MAG: recombinase family protein [Rhodospirillales bacterium]
MPPRKIGYARVSTDDQCLDLQVDALRAAGCGRIFSDRGISGGVRERPELARALTLLQGGDVLVVWKLDRLGRSVAHLIEILEELSIRGVHFESLTEKLDTTTAFGEFAFHTMAGLAQMERKMIGERTKAGLAAARRRGVVLGRRPALEPDQVHTVQRQMKSGGASAETLAARYGVSIMTIYRACRQDVPPS